MLNKLLYKLTALLPCRLIKLDGGPYLERYYLGQLFGVTFYLHRFVSSDSERHIHNHPWNWGASLIVAGSYIEERCVDICPSIEGSGCLTSVARRRWFNRVDGNTFHRISDARPGTWTLFFHGPRVKVGGGLKGWGFLESRYIIGLHEKTTIFVQARSGPDGWWMTAPKGNTAGRVEL